METSIYGFIYVILYTIYYLECHNNEVCTVQVCFFLLLFYDLHFTSVNFFVIFSSIDTNYIKLTRSSSLSFLRTTLKKISNTTDFLHNMFVEYNRDALSIT